MARTGKTEVVLNLKVSDGELSLIFDKAKKGFARLTQDQKESLKLQEKQDAAAKKYSVSKTTEGKAIQRTNAETREENRLATLSQANKVRVTKAVEKLTFANSQQNIKIQENNVLAREQNRIINLELNQSIQLKKSKERLAFAQSDVGKQTEINNALSIEANRISKVGLSRDIQLTKAQEDIAFWTSKKGKELAKANLQAKEAANQAQLLAIKEMEAADAAKELSNATKGVAKGFDQMKTTAGLSGAIVTEVGRTISDAPYGLRGMGNNISQLASLFGMFSVNVKKSGRTMGQGFKQLAASMMGPIGIITGVQVLVALLQSGAFEKMISFFSDASNETQKLNREMRKLTESVYANQLVANQYLNTLKSNNISESERIVLIKELKKIVPSLKDEDFSYGENLDIVTDKIKKYALAQASRLQIDKLTNDNQSVLAKKAEILNIKAIEDEEERGRRIKQLLKEQVGFFDNNYEETVSALGQRNKAIQEGLDPYFYFPENLKGMEVQLGSRFKKTAALLLEDLDDFEKEIDEKSSPILKRITELLFNTDGSTDKPTLLDRKIKEFSKKSFNLLSEILGFEQELLETTSRSQQQIIKDEQKAKEDAITIKRDEFKEKEKLRLKNYIAQQEANKKLKGADIVAIDAAIARAKEKSAKSIQESNNEATAAIAAIEEVTKARIKNQQDLEAFEKMKADMAISESGDATSLATMPEGMAKVEAEAALDQLRYDNKVLAAERELALLTTTEERKREIETQMSLWRDEKRIVDLENEQNEIDEKTRIQQQYINYISSLSSILSAIGGKNEHLRKVALIAEKGAAIASVAVEASASIGKQTSATTATSAANLANLATQGGPTNVAAAATFAAAEKANKASYIKNVAQTKIGAGLSIAAIAAGTVAQLSGGRSSSSGGGGGGQTVQAPDFNIIGSTGVNQLADVIGGTTQQPIKAYVVSSEVTSAQELDRNIIDSASL